jgi:hypothetical protein
MGYIYKTDEEQIKKIECDSNFRLLCRIYYHANKFNIPKKYISKITLGIEEKIDDEYIDIIAWNFTNKFNSYIQCCINEFGEDAELCIIGCDHTYGVDVYESLDIIEETVVCYWFPYGMGNDRIKLKEHKGIEK